MDSHEVQTRAYNKGVPKGATAASHSTSAPPAAASAAASAATCRRRSFSAARAAPSALHTRLCPPSRQSACEQAVLQYHTARQALQIKGGGVGSRAQGHSRKQQPGRHECKVVWFGQPGMQPAAALQPTHLQRMLPSPSPAAGPPSPPRLAQRR